MGSRGHGVTLLVAAVLVAACAPHVIGDENVDPGNTGAQYAYGENVGWVNAEPGGDGARGVEVTDEELLGFMWAENAGWISLSCVNDSSCGTSRYRVVNDGCGRLSGEAWAENLGWIRFNPNHAGVVIDPRSGLFSGRAWNENAGWITFGGSGLAEHGLRTGWRRHAPAGAPELFLRQEGASTSLEWTMLDGADVFDVVYGDISALLEEGDFSHATQGCLEDDSASNGSQHDHTPAPGTGLWFLVRGCNCGGAGTYDSESVRQHHPRGGQIEDSGAGCP